MRRPNMNPMIIRSNQVTETVTTALNLNRDLFLVFPSLQWLDHAFMETALSMDSSTVTVRQSLKAIHHAGGRQIMFLTTGTMERIRGRYGLVAFVVDDAFAHAWADAYLVVTMRGNR
jgi:hypothetical protein